MMRNTRPGGVSLPPGWRLSLRRAGQRDAGAAEARTPRTSPQPGCPVPWDTGRLCRWGLVRKTAEGKGQISQGKLPPRGGCLGSGLHFFIAASGGTPRLIAPELCGCGAGSAPGVWVCRRPRARNASWGRPILRDDCTTEFTEGSFDLGGWGLGGSCGNPGRWGPLDPGSVFLKHFSAGEYKTRTEKCPHKNNSVIHHKVRLS